MNTSIRSTVLALSTLVLISLTAFAANANDAKPLLAPPDPGAGLLPEYRLPQFGFASFNIGGVGERVTYVRWGGIASRLGLEPGDIILSLNGFRLRYHGAWNDALYQAMLDGGWVQLGIRDVRSGRVVYRHTFVGGLAGPIGPVTPKFYGGANFDSPQSHLHIRRPSDSIGAKKGILRVLD
jgi:hypothetical protein